MEIKFVSNVLTVISALFPGSIQGFRKEGVIITVGFPSDEVVVYHPGLPENIKKTLIELAANTKNTISFMDQPNFVGYTSEDIQEVLNSIHMFFLKTNPDVRIRREEITNLIAFNFPTVLGKEEDVLDFVFSYLKSIEGLNLSYVTVKDTAFKIVPHKETIKIVAEHGVITEDDVTNLCIDIESAKTVEDFLKKL